MNTERRTDWKGFSPTWGSPAPSPPPAVALDAARGSGTPPTVVVTPPRGHASGSTVKGTTTRPLDDGASTLRWARAPARGLAAAPPPTPPPIGHWATAAPLSAARERKEEGKKIEGGSRHWDHFGRRLPHRLGRPPRPAPTATAAVA